MRTNSDEPGVIELGGSLDAAELTVGAGNVQLNAEGDALAALEAIAASPLVSQVLKQFAPSSPAGPTARSSGSIRIAGNVRADRAVIGEGNVQLTATNRRQILSALPAWALVDLARRLTPSDALLERAERLGLLSATYEAFERNVQPRHQTLDPALWRRKLATLERVVGRVEANGRPRGTCFLVGPDLVLTNYHVVEEFLRQADGSAIRVRFDYQLHAPGEELPGVLHGLVSKDWCCDYSPYSSCDTQVNAAGAPKGGELDYALLRLDSTAGANDSSEPPRGWLSLEQSLDIEPGDALLILQHPLGDRLKLCFGRVLDVPVHGKRLKYDTNTEPGSSGAPCFNDSLELVGLHHMGDPEFAPGYRAKFNQGVPVRAIARRLSERGIQLACFSGASST